MKKKSILKHRETTDCNTTCGCSGPQAHHWEPINLAALIEYHTRCFAHVIMCTKRTCLLRRVIYKRHPLSVRESTATWRRGTNINSVRIYAACRSRWSQHLETCLRLSALFDWSRHSLYRILSPHFAVHRKSVLIVTCYVSFVLCVSRVKAVRSASASQYLPT